MCLIFREGNKIPTGLALSCHPPYTLYYRFTTCSVFLLLFYFTIYTTVNVITVSSCARSPTHRPANLSVAPRHLQPSAMKPLVFLFSFPEVGSSSTVFSTIFLLSFYTRDHTSVKFWPLKRP